MGTSRILLLIPVAAFVVRAQTADPALTNADIESMVSGGLPESTIVMKIHKAAHFGLVDLDSSARALMALKEKGAGEQILNAVVWAEPFGAEYKQDQIAQQEAAEQRRLEEQATPGLPEDSGVYFKSSSQWVRAPGFLFWMPLYSGQAWIRGLHEYFVPVANDFSAVPVSGAMPTFYVRSARPRQEWQIVRISSRNGQRQLRMVSGHEFEQGAMIAANQVRSVQMTHVAGSVFSLRPGAQLDSGDHALCTEVLGGPGLRQCYSFTVRP